MDWVKKRSDIFFLGLLIVFWAIFHYRVLFEGRTFVFLDCSSFFFPLWKWGGSLFRKGLVPLWNSQACFGTPFLADPEMDCWYPPVPIFYCLFHTVSAFNLLVLIHHLWAILGFYFFARGRQQEPVVSFLGTLIFGFSFEAISLSWACSMLFAFSWIPWVFWSFGEMMKGKRLFFALFSFFAAMQLAAGYPVFFYLTFLVLALDGVLLQIQNKGGLDAKWILRGVAGYGGGLVFAFLYNMAWIIPFEEFLGWSNIAKRLASLQSLNWNYLGTLFNPFLLGQPLYSHPIVPLFVSDCFMGLPVIAVLLIMVFRGKIHKASFFLFLLTLILSVGEPFKLFDGFRDWVPGYVWVVRSGYIIPLVIFSGAVFFMESVSDWMGNENKTHWDYGRWFGVSVLVYGFALWMGVPATLLSFWLSLIFLLLVGLQTKYPDPLRWLCLIFSLVFSLGPVVLAFNFTMNHSYYEKKPQVCEYLKVPGRIYFSLTYAMNHFLFSGKSISDAYEQLNENINPNRPLTWGLEEILFNNPLFLSSYLRWDFTAFQISKSFSGKVLNYLDVRYVFGKNSLRQLVPLGDPQWHLYENPDPMPKWFSVAKTLPASNWKDDFYLESQKGFNFKNECLTSRHEDVGSYSRRALKVFFRSPDHIDFLTGGRGRAFIASSQTDYPGWQIDTGKGWRPVDDVNDGFQGFVLGKQEKAASLVYRPTSFRLGCFLSLVTMALWGVLSFIFWLEKDMKIDPSI